MSFRIDLGECIRQQMACGLQGEMLITNASCGKLRLFRFLVVPYLNTFLIWPRRAQSVVSSSLQWANAVLFLVAALGPDMECRQSSNPAHAKLNSHALPAKSLNSI